MQSTVFESRVWALAALLFFIFQASAKASTGTSGAAFLDIPVGAAPAALGSAYTSLATNAYAPVWNPAGLGFLSAPEVAGQHLSYLQSIGYEFASFAIPLRKDSPHPAGLGGSIQYLGTGDIPGTDTSGAAIGTYSNHYAAYNLAYGQSLTEKLSLGLTAKMIEAKLADVSAHAYAGDVGALYKANEKLQLAATLVNAGSQLKFSNTGDNLPLAFHTAAAYAPDRHLAVSLEGVYNRDGLGSVRAGLEWKPIEMIALRAGYRTDTLKELSALAGLSTGLGIKFLGQEFSYAWLPYGDLGDTQYFSLLLRFGKAEEEKRNLIQYQTIKTHRTVKSGQSVPEPGDADYQQLMQLLQEGKEPVAQSGKVESKP